MRLTIDAASPTPPFEQLRRALLERMQDGTLAPGTRLPPVRQLAAELDLAPGTVARAYKELEEVGALETRGRAGTFAAWSSDAAERRVEQLAAQLARAANEDGIPAERVRAIVDSALSAD
ncbi:GntR family transcriptional regulator [Homoserinibacter sp. GY 40078]|uniref:GntR family transcriptional regulator n=1 Tax=Homoserinibacter sp. GY 40078 TaxID=2603275 RepID=UPI0011C77C87|nr:GntR family transcriptional regulator [Homoserinibacter sp. GY 40078]TXK19008.1 GntR family transcriptional regulator [Homoserinibacter sp. GY 40078]